MEIMSELKVGSKYSMTIGIEEGPKEIVEAIYLGPSKFSSYPNEYPYEFAHELKGTSDLFVSFVREDEVHESDSKLTIEVSPLSRWRRFKESSQNLLEKEIYGLLKKILAK